MVNWYNMNLCSSFTNTGEFASRAASVVQVKDCEDCKVSSITFNKQRELLMKQDKKLEEFHKKPKQVEAWINTLNNNFGNTKISEVFIPSFDCTWNFVSSINK